MPVSSYSLANKKILLAVTGSIAAYKSAELVRLLRKCGAEVRVVMSQSATHFITPLTLQALSGNPVHQYLLDPESEAGMGHIELARWADALLVAPASANFIAKLAHGLADDLLSTLTLACTAPLLIAPAMNQAMWRHPATVANCITLVSRSVQIIEPTNGEQACGDNGPGRMQEPTELVAVLNSLFVTQKLAGCHLLITAGPTREAIDPVRYISNRSSGRMGYAIATAAHAAGAEVTLISGPTSLTPPVGVKRIDVESAQQMMQEVIHYTPRCDIFIATAAVADYRPQTAAKNKIKKSAQSLDIALEKTPDILAQVAANTPPPFTVGFAAETDELESNARSKLKNKCLDMIAANWVGQPDRGFDSEHNALNLYWAGGSQEIALANKQLVAQQLIETIAERYHAQNPG